MKVSDETLAELRELQQERNAARQAEESRAAREAQVAEVIGNHLGWQPGIYQAATQIVALLDGAAP